MKKKIEIPALMKYYIQNLYDKKQPVSVKEESFSVLEEYKKLIDVSLKDYEIYRNKYFNTKN